MQAGDGPGCDDDAPRREGEEIGADDLSGTVYATLRAIAQRQMLDERAGHTLTATALVHEAYLRLFGREAIRGGRGAFYEAASQAMRRILIDHARRKKALKRGGGARRLEDFENVVEMAMLGDPDEILALEEALVRLEGRDARAAAVVRLRFFAGLSGDEAAETLGISPRQVDREWAYARAFLLKELRPGDGRAGG